MKLIQNAIAVFMYNKMNNSHGNLFILTCTACKARRGIRVLSSTFNLLTYEIPRIPATYGRNFNRSSNWKRGECFLYFRVFDVKVISPVGLRRSWYFKCKWLLCSLVDRKWFLTFMDTLAGIRDFVWVASISTLSNLFFFKRSINRFWIWIDVDQNLKNIAINLILKK